MAEESFNLEQAGLAMKSVFEKVLVDKPQDRKVFINIGVHTGEHC